ncbi:MAG: hypothetical protein RBS77_02640 [Candidatus Moranbacteria bacterium]|jgi:hypothetical protein|nr:hypothetical protein [Candidatus Moranbacteria bacterium]
MKHSDSLQLNKKDKQIYRFANFIIFFLLTLFILFMLVKVIFPSQFFTYSFANVNSLKNTLTDIIQDENWINFYASTPLNFSRIKVNLELDKSSPKLDNQKIIVEKSYKAFFYPEGSVLTNLDSKEENTLISIDDSVFIIGNQQKTPIDSTVTFESLGYDWNNLAANTTDLSLYEKQKLADINAAHPTGTILKTTGNNYYYFVENYTKRKIVNPAAGNIKNAIAVDEKSSAKYDVCVLEKNKLFNRKYSCSVPLSQIVNLIGKDYRFTIADLPTDIKIKKIDVEFKKSLTKDNFQFFLSELKKKVLYRFGFKEA